MIFTGAITFEDNRRGAAIGRHNRYLKKVE
jgi:hypothetical protein